MDSVKELLVTAIPSLQGEKLEAVLKHLEAKIGVESVSDLNFVDAERDFCGILRPIDARKVAHFLTSFRQSSGNASNVVPCRDSSNQEPSTSATTPRASTSASLTSDSACTIVSLPTPTYGWAESFNVPWAKMPEEFLAACREGKRPEKRHVLAAVRMTATDIRKVSRNPGKASLSTIARAMVSRYDKSLGDFIPGVGLLGDGATSLTNRLLRQLENLNRTPGNSLRRKLFPTETPSNNESETPEGTRKRKVFRSIVKDAYGCVAWQPELPTGECDETQKRKQKWLIAEFQKAENLQDNPEILKLMLETYPTQRFNINQKTLSVAQIFVDWPFLLRGNGLLNHFKTLLGFELSDRFQQHFATKGRLVVDYALHRGNRQAKAVAAQLEARSKVLKNDIPLTFGSFLLLCHLMKENEHLIMMHEEVVDRHEMQEKGPIHPHVACAGDDVFNGSCCFVIIDRHALEACDFGSAITVLFAAYYVFNVAYPEGSINTLEFVQRALAEINPARGSKSTKVKTKVPSAVLHLLSELLTIH